MIAFKGAQYPESAILYAVFFYFRYGVSYRDLKEIMADHLCHGGSLYVEPMGRQIRAADRRKCPNHEATNCNFLAHG